MQATIFHTIADIDAREWDAVVGVGRLFQSHAWLGVLEAGSIVDYTPIYVVVRDSGGAMMATAAAFVMPTSLITLSSGPFRSAVEAIQQRLPWFFRPRILECGSPLGPGNGISLRKGVAMAQVAPILAKALDGVAAQQRARLIVLRDLIDAELPIAEAFAPWGFVPVEGFPTMSLPIRWTSYEAYWRAMSSRQRQKMKRGLSLASQNGLHPRWVDLAPGAGERLAAERENVRTLAREYSREQVTPGFFEALQAAFGSRARVLEVMAGTERIGHALVVDDGDVLRWLSFGRASAGARDGAYFLVIATIVELAIRERKAELDMGITTQGPKTDFGAEVVRQWMLVRVRGLPRSALAAVIGLFSPRRERSTRRPVSRAE